MRIWAVTLLLLCFTACGCALALNADYSVTVPLNEMRQVSATAGAKPNTIIDFHLAGALQSATLLLSMDVVGPLQTLSVFIQEQGQNVSVPHTIIHEDPDRLTIVQGDVAGALYLSSPIFVRMTLEPSGLGAFYVALYATTDLPLPIRKDPPVSLTLPNLFVRWISQDLPEHVEMTSSVEVTLIDPSLHPPVELRNTLYDATGKVMVESTDTHSLHFETPYAFAYAACDRELKVRMLLYAPDARDYRTVGETSDVFIVQLSGQVVESEALTWDVATPLEFSLKTNPGDSFHKNSYLYPLAPRQSDLLIYSMSISAGDKPVQASTLVITDACMLDRTAPVKHSGVLITAENTHDTHGVAVLPNNTSLYVNAMSNAAGVDGVLTVTTAPARGCTELNDCGVGHCEHTAIFSDAGIFDGWSPSCVCPVGAYTQPDCSPGVPWYGTLLIILAVGGVLGGGWMWWRTRFKKQGIKRGLLGGHANYSTVGNESL